MMTKEKLKTVGLSADVWKQLKLMTIENDCTITEAVELLLKIAEEQNNAKPDQPAGKTRKKPGQEPG